MAFRCTNGPAIKRSPGFPPRDSGQEHLSSRRQKAHPSVASDFTPHDSDLTEDIFAHMDNFVDATAVFKRGDEVTFTVAHDPRKDRLTALDIRRVPRSDEGSGRRYWHKNKKRRHFK